jgi:dTMP kinase
VAARLRQGVLVTLEGGEGAGKSSQVEALAERLQEAGYTVTTTFEPGATALGEIVKAVFRQEMTVTPEVELFLFEADRAQHVEEVIRPAIERHDVVLCDRYTDSTVAYQGYGRGLSPDHIRAANHIATRGLAPHLTILLDVTPQTGLARKRGETAADNIGTESVEFHERVRAGYLEIAGREPKRIALVDAARPAKEVTQEAWRRLQAFLDHIL